MKVTATRHGIELACTCEFLPFTLNLVIESKEEAIKLFVLFNHVHILECLNLNGEAVRKVLNECTSITHSDYSSLFNKLDNIVKSYY